MDHPWIPFPLRKWDVLTPLIAAPVVIIVLVAVRLRGGPFPEAIGTSAGADLMALVVSFGLDNYRATPSFKWQAGKQSFALLMALVAAAFFCVPALLQDPDTYFSSAPNERFYMIGRYGNVHGIKTARELGREHWAMEVGGSGTFALALGAFSIMVLRRNLRPPAQAERISI